MSSSSTELFSRLRPRLMAIGYRMLGSVQEAEDLVQDAWLRWHDEAESARAAVLVPEAWLVTVTTRMAIDRLRSAKLRRAAYPGTWLPEPFIEEGPASPEQIRELADDVSIAFLVLLDCLTPEARAAFLLREVFEVDYEQIAVAIGKSEAAARQTVHRAKQSVAKARGTKRHQVRTPPQEQYEQLRRLVQAITRGDLAGVRALLDDEAALVGDFGGGGPSLRSTLSGAQRIAQLYYAHHLRHGGGMRLELALLNGEWALLRYLEGELESVQAFEFDRGRISQVRIQRNPAKLAGIKRQGHLLLRGEPL
ncbi:sigma-70 family RNA polymerase sigma factor [Caenimonas aquaedulcis]|uniref:Sigma-70 family RNA polymerase sigma factor n=1 Tax=Caenimonas aquaedulcis TaxID=2793270 RepID=A0A931H8P1_9BURK|nr:sigma-70 family RNA polymerase sigma factor [Caenimonas aquaedulcis]MBG9390583.1 sigma-70 family RNA polymerase sigma factor [Caenimonas aquaedulcis]